MALNTSTGPTTSMLLGIKAQNKFWLGQKHTQTIAQRVTETKSHSNRRMLDSAFQKGQQSPEPVNVFLKTPNF